MNFLDPRLPERFWSKCVPEPNSGCWLWFGGDAHGYGRVRANGRAQPAHRVALSVIESINPALEIDHKCQTRECVNPAHLHQVTRQTNCKLTRDRNKTCRRGHEWNGQNTSWRVKRGYDIRVCRACYRDYSAEWHRKRDDR